MAAVADRLMGIRRWLAADWPATYTPGDARVPEEPYVLAHHAPLP